jgi:LPS-assembly protein
MSLRAHIGLCSAVVKRFPASLALACAHVCLAFVVFLLGPAPAAAAAAAPDPFISSLKKDEPIKVRADQITHDRDTGVAIAIGDVIIDFGPYKLIADRVIYDPRTDSMTAIGNVYFREPNGNVVRAEKLNLSDRFRQGFVDYLTVLFTNEAWIRADSAVRENGNVQVFTNVTYSRCNECVDEDGTPLWQLRSKTVTHVEDEGTIYHEDSTLEFFGLPVLYMPWLSHPDPTVKRKTGFLIPTIHASSEFGVGLETPFFWNLAPNYDVTFRPVFTTKQGVLAQADFRHRLENGEYFVNLSGIYQLNPPSASVGDRRWRGRVHTAGEFDITQNWFWGWDITATSDDTFMRKYDIDNRTDLVSQIYLTGLDGRNYLHANVAHYQGLLADDNNNNFPIAAPFIEHNYTFADPIFGGELAINTHAFHLEREAGADSARVSTDILWQRRMVNGLGQVVTPFAGVRGDLYVVDNVRDPTVPGGVRGNETVARAQPRAGVDVRWPFVSYMEGSQHIIEPAAQIIASTNETDENQLPNDDSVQFEYDPTNLFLHNKFTGIDRQESGTRANIGLNYTMLFDSGGFIRASAGETFHIAGQNSFGPGSGLDTYRSDFVASLAIQPVDNIMLSSTIRLDERTFDIRRHDVNAVANFGPLDVAGTYSDVSAAPAFGRLTAEEQVTALATLALSDEWEVFGGTRYDIQQTRQVGNLIGLRFNCDCFTAEIVYSENFTDDRDVDQESRILFRIVLKSLGGAAASTEID